MTIVSGNTMQEEASSGFESLRNQVLTLQQKHDERLKGLAGVYQTTDRILTGEGLTLAVEPWPGTPVAAWTDGTKITINSDVVSAVDADNIERMHGVNFHELAHILYTPRKGTTLVSWVLDNDYKKAFNLLEDQRIETLLTGRYPSTVPWLQAAIARWVIKGDSGNTGYLWVRGRKYLDGRLRGALRSAFVEPSLLPEIDRIVDEYRTLVFPNDYDRARPLIHDFKTILDALLQQGDPDDGGGMPGEDPYGHGDRPTDVLTHGRQRSVSEQRTARDRAQDGEPEVEPDDDSSQDSQDSESKDSQSAPAVEPESEEQDGPQVSPDPEASGSDDDDPTSSNPGGTPSSSRGDAEGQDTEGMDASSSTAGSQSGADFVKDIAEQVLAEIRSHEEVRKDISRTQRQIMGAQGSDLIDRARWNPQTPLSSYSTLFGTLRRSLERLVRKADPGWETRNATGRVNVQRWAAEKNIDTAFDLWDEGVHDAVDMEVVVMIDESGSMHSVSEQAANAMWVVKRALDKIDASTTVITFDTASRVLYHRTDRADAQVRYSFSGGGTNPSDGLAQAARIFGRTKRSQKILIVFTDGVWDRRRSDEGLEADEYIDRFNKAGVTTALGFISDKDWIDLHGGQSSTHGCRITSTVAGEGLVRFISTIVTETISKRLVGR